MTRTAADPAAWAARQVGLTPGASPDEVRGALLREVTRDAFVPPPERQAAWRVLCSPPGARPPLPPEWLLAEEARLRGEVEDFAAAFFATSVAARRERWQALSDQCAFSPPLTARLAALQPALGLDLALGDIGNPRTAQLASQVAGLFVLAPSARAVQRQSVQRSMQGDIAGWEEAVRQLQTLAPAVAALEPTLLSSILNWRDRQHRLERARAGRETPSRPAPRARGRAGAAARAPAPAVPAAKGSGAGKGVGCGAAVLASIIIRVCIGLGTYRSPEPQVPQFQAPHFQQPQFDPKMFEQIDRMQQFNKEIEEENRRKKEGDDLQRILDDLQRDNRAEPGEAKPRPPADPAPPPRDDAPVGPGIDTRRGR